MSSPARRILAAYWTAPGQGVVLFHRNWDAARLPRLILDGHGAGVARVERLHPLRLASFTGFSEMDGQLVFALDPQRFPHVDFEHNPVRVAGPFNDWGRAEHQEPWILRPLEGPDGQTLYAARVDRNRLGPAKQLIFKFVTQDWHWLTPLRGAPNVEYDKAGNANYRLHLGRTGRHAFEFEIDPGHRGLDTACRIGWDDAGTVRTLTPLRPGLGFYDLHTDAPLGAIPEGRFTTFRVFAPRARSVRLEIHDSLEEPVYNHYDMELSGDRLCWEVQLRGNLHGWYYRYYVDGDNDGVTTDFDAEQPVLDPYAKAVCAHDGPGIIIDPKRIREPKYFFQPPPWQNLITLECHVRDIVAQAPVEMPEEDRLGFRGLTRYLSDEMCYLRTLGANALEFQPIQQFDSTSKGEYHWGYMTTNYFSPCAWYGSDPAKAKQNTEFRDMVEACHERGLTVIIDVVYNHVGVPNHLGRLDKAYYFYLTDEGDYENWSGCGNTLRAESAMATRLVIDSLVHLVLTYDVDGFRFDLAELIGVETLRRAGDALKAVKQGIILIAEPWSFRGGIQWDTRMAGYAFWNDGFRGFVADYVKGIGNADGLAYFMKGCLDHMAAWPAQSVNYTESHDDRCWLDKITTNKDYKGDHPSHLDVRRTHMMAAIVLGSVGFPMIAEGQDFLRSKHGINNTYQRGDVNALNYDRLQHYGLTHHYFQQWIGFRLSEWGEVIRLWDRPGDGYLRLFKCENGKRNAAAILFNADCTLGPRQVLLAINPHNEPLGIPLYDVDGMHWKCLADAENFNYQGLFDHRMDGHKHRLNLGNLDVGLWVRETR